MLETLENLKPILVIDDNINSFQNISEMLSKMGLVNEWCTNPISALKRIERDPDIALILSNVHFIAGRDMGYYLTNRIKHNYHVPVVLMDRDNSIQTVQNSFIYGAADFIKKPVVFITLKRIIFVIFELDSLTCT